MRMRNNTLIEARACNCIRIYVRVLSARLQYLIIHTLFIHHVGKFQTESDSTNMCELSTTA